MHEAGSARPSGFLELRHAATDHPIFVVVPERRLIAIDGTGTSGAADFRMATELLRAVHELIRARLRHDRFSDGPRPVLEIGWGTSAMPATQVVESFAQHRALRWRQMLELPGQATAADFEDAAVLARREAGRTVPLIRTFTYSEGRSAQILHVGAMAELAPSIARLAAFVTDAGFHSSGDLHQLVYADPDRAPSDRQRSILRVPIA